MGEDVGLQLRGGQPPPAARLGALLLQLAGGLKVGLAVPLQRLQGEALAAHRAHAHSHKLRSGMVDGCAGGSGVAVVAFRSWTDRLLSKRLACYGQEGQPQPQVARSAEGSQQAQHTCDA